MYELYIFTTKEKQYKNNFIYFGAQFHKVQQEYIVMLFKDFCLKKFFLLMFSIVKTF